MRLWVVLLAILALVALPLASRAQQPEPVAGAEEAIVRADALGANRDYAGAIALLKRAIDRYPTYTRVYLSLAYWQEVRGLYTTLNAPTNAGLEARKRELRVNLDQYTDLARELFDTYGRAMLYVPDARDIQRNAADLVGQEYPLVLGETGPLALPGTPNLFTYAISDPMLPTDRRGAHQCLLIGPLLTPSPVIDPFKAGYTKDPKYGLDPTAHEPAYANMTFNRMLLAYEYDNTTKCWYLRFRVMWLETPSRAGDRLQLARNTAQLLLRLHGLVRAYTGLAPRFAQRDGVPLDIWTVNTWLAEKGQAGGETVDDDIYLFEVGTPRSAAEWVREIAHEYGHETLPVIGGYLKPEWGANGRLGERLFLRWLLRNPDTLADAHPWVRNIDPVVTKETRIDSLIRQFAALGPDAPKLGDTDGLAMDAFVGLALYLEQTRGAEALTSVLGTVQSPVYAGKGSFKSALETYEAMGQTSEQPVVTLRLQDLPAGLPLWVFLQKGVWRLEFETGDDTPARMTVELDGKPCRSEMPGSVTGPLLAKDGWYRIKLTPTGNTLPPLTTLRLVKQ